MKKLFQALVVIDDFADTPQLHKPYGALTLSSSGTQISTWASSQKLRLISAALNMQFLCWRLRNQPGKHTGLFNIKRACNTAARSCPVLVQVPRANLTSGSVRRIEFVQLWVSAPKLESGPAWNWGLLENRDLPGIGRLTEGNPDPAQKQSCARHTVTKEQAATAQWPKRLSEVTQKDKSSKPWTL